MEVVGKAELNTLLPEDSMEVPEPDPLVGVAVAVALERRSLPASPLAVVVFRPDKLRNFSKQFHGST